MTKSIISILGAIKHTPSNAIKFALDGIKKQQERTDFRIDISTYGYYEEEDDVCCGCVATCAIQKIAGKNLASEEINSSKSRSETLRFNEVEMKRFEMAINQARIGNLKWLFIFCEIDSCDYFELSKVFYGKWGCLNDNVSLDRAINCLKAAYTYLKDNKY